MGNSETWQGYCFRVTLPGLISALYLHGMLSGHGLTPDLGWYCQLAPCLLLSHGAATCLLLPHRNYGHELLQASLGFSQCLLIYSHMPFHALFLSLQFDVPAQTGTGEGKESEGCLKGAQWVGDSADTRNFSLWGTGTF